MLLNYLRCLQQLANAEEFQDEKSNGLLGEIFIRYVEETIQFIARLTQTDALHIVGVTTSYT